MIVLKRDRFYQGRRPHAISEFEIAVNTNLQQSLQDVVNGTRDYDIAGLPPDARPQLAATYGVNRGQYQVHPMGLTDYVALNTSRTLFSVTAMRQAVNFAIPRQQMAAADGPFAATPTAHMLPPVVPGWRQAAPYPLRTPNFSRAKALTAGRSCDATIAVAPGAISDQESILLGQSLRDGMGCIVRFQTFPTVTAYFNFIATPGNAWDATVLSAAAPPLYDPSSFLNTLLNPAGIGTPDNQNFAYFNNAKVNRLLERAARLRGPARYKSYGDLDLLITKNYAPWASYDNRNEREFVSKRVGGYLFQPANASADLNTFFLK